MQGVMKDDVSKEPEAGRQEMAKTKTESGKLRAESDHGEGANVQRSTSNIQGNAEQSRLGGSGAKFEVRRSQVDKHDARRRQLDAGERKFLEALIRFTRGAKRSRVPEVAVAARRWEGKIHFHVRVTLQRRRER